MQVERMAAPLGAVIRDLDVRDVDAQTPDALNQLFCEHHVLVFPEQDLSPADQIEFAGLWGPLIRSPYMGLDD